MLHAYTLNCYQNKGINETLLLFFKIINGLLTLTLNLNDLDFLKNYFFITKQMKTHILCTCYWFDLFMLKTTQMKKMLLINISCRN